jgi:protease secretion system membrane fusion protein
MVKLIEKNTQATEVITHDVAPLTVNIDSRSYSRMGWLIVLLGVGGFILWAALAPLDKGVPLPGNLVAESNRKSIQYLSGGTVEEILVKDGDVVKAGQVLVRMSDVVLKSQSELTRTQYFAARATEARLLAERDGAGSVAFPAALAEYKDDPRVVTNMSLQAQLFSSRQSALKNEMAAVEENISGIKSQIQGLEESRDSKKEQLSILKEQLGNMRDLAKEGYVARSRLLDLERTNAQINGALSEDIGNIGRSRRQIMELTLRRIQRTQEYQKEVRTQLADVQKEAEGLANRAKGQDFELASTEVKAPVDGVIVGSAVFTKGGVVGSGFRMMDIVPSDDALIVEGQLPVNMVDKVHKGLPVDMIFSAFNTNKTPHLPGIVTQVSADRTVDEKTGMAFYKIRAKVTPEGVAIIDKKKLEIQSGMPVEIMVKTGERTLMSYLLKPVFDRAKTSLSED